MMTISFGFTRATRRPHDAPLLRGVDGDTVNIEPFPVVGDWQVRDTLRAATPGRGLRAWPSVLPSSWPTPGGRRRGPAAAVHARPGGSGGARP